MGDMEMTKLIEKKRDGAKLTNEEIDYFIKAVVKTIVNTDSEVPVMDNAQIGAMLMAIYLKGIDTDETTELTMRMRDSGYVFSWPEEWKIVDKHSTGGVGDKVSLVLAPALAALGLKVPMISGRSLSHTGGTLNKLESIPGFRTFLSKEEIYNAMKTVGCCIVEQTEDCVPADKVLYKCRELTATVNYPPLIIASIVSKKLSERPKSIVYDVKYGKGSVFHTKEEALNTAVHLVEHSKNSTKASALLTSMEWPLGESIGNSLEVLEALKCLRGYGPQDLQHLVCALGSYLLEAVSDDEEPPRIDQHEHLILEVLKDGRALQKFAEMIINQGVSKELAHVLCYGKAESVLPKTLYKTVIYYDGEEGYIQEMDPLVLANVCKDEEFRSNQHPGVGLRLLKVIGHRIETGDAWVIIHHQSDRITDGIRSQLQKSLRVGKEKPKKVLIHDVISHVGDELTEKHYLIRPDY